MKGSFYLGSSDLQTSVADEEIIPEAPETWTTTYKFYEFSFMNDDVCTVKINGSEDAIYLRANQGFTTTINDAPITSLKIVEDSVKFTWFGKC